MILVSLFHYNQTSDQYHARAQTSVQINDQALEFVDILMRDKEFVEIYRKGLSNQPLNENEVVQFSYFIVRMAGLLESNVTAAKAGVSFEGDYDVEFLYGNPFMHKLINTDVGERWFKEDARMLFSEEFLSNISAHRNKDLSSAASA